jgi:hypothetical protein
MSERRSAVRKLDADFSLLLHPLHPKLQQLLTMLPVSGGMSQTATKSGVYLFSEVAQHICVGRINAFRKDGPDIQAAFALRLAREVTGYTKPVFRKDGSQVELINQPEFKAALETAKARIRAMDYRFVEETDPARQALLEIYAASVLKTPYTGFSAS